MVFKTRNIGKQRRSRLCKIILIFSCFVSLVVIFKSQLSGRDDFREDYKRAAVFKGEVTVYLRVFILLISFAGAMLESASLQNVNNYRRADSTGSGAYLQSINSGK